MAQGDEIIAAVLATWATSRLTRGVDVPWGRLEAAFRTDLSGTTSHRSRARFSSGTADAGRTPVEWLDDLERRGADRVRIAGPDADEPSRRPTLGGLAVEPHRLHAFAGSGGLVVAARVADRLERHRSRLWLPPETTLRAVDVIAFVAGRATADALRDALLWQDRHNLHVTDGSDWTGFVRALRDEHDGPLVRAMDMVVSNVGVPRDDAEAWIALKRERVNPAFAWQFDLVRVDDALAEPPVRPLVEQSSRLREALLAIEAFARAIGEAGFAEAFRASLAALDARAPSARVSGWFAGAGLPVDAISLVEAALAADVFGGMGSWNDLAPADTQAYQRVSATLFAELIPSLASAVDAASG